MSIRLNDPPPALVHLSDVPKGTAFYGLLGGQDVVGIAVRSHQEEAAIILSITADIGVAVPTWQYASAYRGKLKVMPLQDAQLSLAPAGSFGVPHAFETPENGDIMVADDKPFIYLRSGGETNIFDLSTGDQVSSWTNQHRNYRSWSLAATLGGSVRQVYAR